MQYFRVDELGKIVEVLSESEEDELVVEGWGEDQSFCDPTYDFELQGWKEGLSPEELDERRKELHVKPLTLEELKAENEMNSLAIMELAEMLLGG